jgi:hypothetical protein
VDDGATVDGDVAVVGGVLHRSHKTESPYAHLALGCALFLVVGHLPIVRGLVTLAVGLIGIGTLVATRIGGLWPGKAPASGPYRSTLSP